MNLFYEQFPETVMVHQRQIPILTDFREYIRLLDMLRDPEPTVWEKTYIIGQYFLEDTPVDKEAIESLTEFVVMAGREKAGIGGEETSQKELFSFRIDYPYILSGFLRDYGIDLDTVEYLHWWKFRMLFDGLSEDTEIRQRIMYRGIDLKTVKDKDERKRIQRIQSSIALPEQALTDYDIGNVFA